jgi:beta-N-acetylhexosaminidase
MVALATYTRIDPGHLAVFSPTVIQSMLRGDLGFRGVVVSDDLGAAVAVADIPPARRALEFIRAGGDLIVSKTAGPADQMAAALVSRAASNPTFKALVDQAALRVLEAKQASGLLPCG